MKIAYPVPDQRVAAYVKGILVIENQHAKGPFYLPLFANGMPTIVFQTVKGQIKHTSNHLTLFGQTVLPEQLVLKDQFTLIAYFLKPYSLFSLWGISAQELTDKPIDLNLILKGNSLEEQLLNATTTEQMMALLDKYLLSLILQRKESDPLIDYATSRILEYSGGSSLTDIQQEICVTERTFQRMFEKHVGVSPRQFRKISQFNRAFQQLNKGLFQSLSDIALGNAYADQSHFNRAFRDFTNLTPKEYLRFRERE